VSYRDFPLKSRSKFAYRSQLATVQLISHTLLAVSCIYHLIVSATVKTYLRWNCQPSFAVFYLSFSGTQRVPGFPPL